MSDDDKTPNKAVALKYDYESAPRVVAKGEGQIADKIIEIAEEHGVTLYQDSELVKLLSRIEVDAQIPSDLYQAVAVVLSFVFQLKGKDKEFQERYEQNAGQ
ncbi:MAG: EscU/YscU/HrcU family type III secretion system export apparatus switch protein [Gammaproteobacteria bacterium]|nr:EscU/YscU/HrcU family type III secretion system export apparatus switch protein [Gammaproteobacteria bacterium]